MCSTRDAWSWIYCSQWGKMSVPLCTVEAVFLDVQIHFSSDRFICFVCHFSWCLFIVNISVRELCSLHGQSLRPGQEKWFPKDHAGFFFFSGVARGLLVYDANHTCLPFPPKPLAEKEHLNCTLQIVLKLQVRQHHFRKYLMNAVNVQTQDNH